MSITYRLLIDLAFYQTALKRYRRQRLNRHRNLSILGIAAIPIVGALIYAWITNAAWIVIPATAVAGGMSGGIVAAVVAWVVRSRNLKRGPEYGGEVTVILNEDGLAARGRHVQTRFEWPAFTRCVRLPDGIMLLRGRVLQWLPDTALLNVTPDEAVAYVRSKTKLVDVE